MTEFQQRVREYIARESRLPASSIDVDTELISSGLVDSFVVVGLVAFLEETLGTRVPTQFVTIEHLNSLELIDALAGQLKARGR